MKRLNLIFSLLILIFSFQISGCSKFLNSEPILVTQDTLALEKSYQQFVDVVKITDWSKAEPNEWMKLSNQIDELRGYRDTPMLARYTSYFMYLKENQIDKAIGVANNIPEDYMGDLQEEIRNIKSEAKALAKAQELKHYEELIRKGDFLTLRKETAQKVTLDTDNNAIYNYLSALEYQRRGIRSAMIISLSHIALPFQGLLSGEITDMVNTNVAEIQLMSNLLSGKTSVGKPKPYIGMTTEEVLATTWGKPSQVISNQTAQGKEEQWEYPMNKVIFIENGFVASIKD